MLGLIICLLIIFSICLFFSTFYNKKFEEIIPFSIFSIVLILYLFGLLKILKIGSYFLLISSVILYIISTIKIIKDKSFKNVVKNILTPGFVMWILFIVYIIFVNFDRLFYTWDEFTHWGSAVYDMYYINALSNSSDSLTNLPKYPQAITILQYFFEFFSTDGFKEWLCFFAYQLCYGSIFIFFLKNITWKSSKILLLTIPIVMFSLPLLYSNFYETIYIDGILGIVFGLNLFLCFIEKDFKKDFYIKLLLSLFILVMLKDSGLILALCVCPLLFFKILFAKNSEKITFKYLIKKFLPVIFAFFIIVFIYLLWHYSFSFATTSSTNEIKQIASYGVGIQGFIDLFLGKNNTYLKDVFNYFLEYTFVKQNIIYMFGLFTFIIFWLFVFKIINIKKDKETKKNINITIVSILIGFFIYDLFLLYSYCTFFSQREAMILASYDRYIYTYFLGVITMIFGYQIYSSKKTKINIGYCILLVIMIYLFNPINKFEKLNNKEYLKAGIEYRDFWFRDYVDDVKNKIDSNNNGIYILSQNSNGLDYWILRYELRDIYNKVNYNIYGISDEKNSHEYSYVNIVSFKDFKKDIFDNYNYLILFNVDEIFIDTYGKLFENKEDIQSKKIYRVDKKQKKIVLYE